MWGQKMFTNGHNFGQQEQVTVEKEDVKQFLTDMHSEIKTMTNNLNNEVTTDTRQKNRISETPDDLPRLAPVSSQKSVEKSEKSTNEVTATSVTIEETIVIRPSDNEDIIEI